MNPTNLLSRLRSAGAPAPRGSPRRRILTGAAVAVAPLLGQGLQAAPAAAAPAEPSAAPDGVINYSCGPDYAASLTYSDYTVTGTKMGNGSWVSLRAGRDPYTPDWVNWTRISEGHTGVDMHLDWSDSAYHSNWHVCHTNDPPNFTPAVNQWGSRWFAAFASAGSGFYGTYWTKA